MEIIAVCSDCATWAYHLDRGIIGPNNGSCVRWYTPGCCPHASTICWVAVGDSM